MDTDFAPPPNMAGISALGTSDADPPPSINLDADDVGNNEDDLSLVPVQLRKSSNARFVVVNDGTEEDVVNSLTSPTFDEAGIDSKIFLNISAEGRDRRSEIKSADVGDGKGTNDEVDVGKSEGADEGKSEEAVVF